MEFLKDQYQFDTSPVIMTIWLVTTRDHKLQQNEKNGGKSFCGDRTDRYFSLKKNLEEKSILVGENEPVL